VLSAVFAVVENPDILPTAGGFILVGFGAFTLPIVARRIGLPSVVLEILFGLILGPQVLNAIRTASVDAEFIQVLAALGLLLLMFLAGFEIDFERLERQGPGLLLTGLAMFGLIVVAAWFGFGLLDPDTTNQRVFLTLLMSASSIGIAVPALRATGRSGTRLGQLTLVITILAEFLSAAAIVVFGVLVREGMGLGLLSVPALFVILSAAFLLLRRLAWWFPERFERLFAPDDPDEMGIRASLALLFVFVGISVALGIEPILGAFLAGAMFAYIFRTTGSLRTRLSGFAYGFFIPVFFINVGVQFPLDQLSEPGTLGKAGLLIAIAIGIKIIPAVALVTRGLTIREALASGVLLAGQLSVIIALAELGVQLEVIDKSLEAGAILLVGVTAILSPIVFRMLAPPLEADLAAPKRGAEDHRP
jgi:Kef-type K+ transport system membrane component KefB